MARQNVEQSSMASRMGAIEQATKPSVMSMNRSNQALIDVNVKAILLLMVAQCQQKRYDKVATE